MHLNSINKILFIMMHFIYRVTTSHSEHTGIHIVRLSIHNRLVLHKAEVNH